MKKYLESTHYINWETPEVLAQAKYLAGNSLEPKVIAQTCFEFVRDEIKHSWDYKLNPVTCNTGQVIAMQKVTYSQHCCALTVFQQVYAISA